MTEGAVRLPYPVGRVCLVASATLLGHALQIANGFYDGRALWALTLALVLSLAAVVALGIQAPATGSLDGLVRLLTLGGIAWQVSALLTAAPGLYLDPRASLHTFNAGVLAMAVLIAAGASDRGGPVRRWWFPALLIVYAGLGVWLLTASPTPAIDVVVVHRAAIDALLAGENPYRITFENIYGPGSPFYNPQVVAGDRVLFGYPYPPVSLLFAVPAHVLVGDYRYAHLAALVGAAALIGGCRSTLNARLAAALLLTTPRGFFVLEQGWTEPLAVFLLALTVYAMLRSPSLEPWSAGLLLVTKQYLAVAVPLIWRALAQSGRKALWSAAAAGALVTVPFAVWDLPAFVDHIVLLQTREPFRVDSLSYLSWAARAGWGEGSFYWAVGASLVGLGLAMWTAPNTAGGLAASLALVCLLAFGFGSKAFCNYYFFVVGALCCALAAEAHVPADTG
jgi:hypothetical protein